MTQNEWNNTWRRLLDIPKKTDSIFTSEAYEAEQIHQKLRFPDKFPKHDASLGTMSLYNPNDKQQ